MIYEIRTYNARPYSVPGYEKRFAEAYETRVKYGASLWGWWHTEIGPLNQMVHIWADESLQQRADVRTAALKDPSGKWPPQPGDELLSQENDILLPVPGMTEMPGEQAWGSVYELRMYTYAPGDLAKVTPAYGAAIAARNAAYPMAGIFTSDLGNLNRLYQLAPYRDWAHREAVRAELREKHLWPPATDARPVSQLVRHLVPAAFSPLH